MPWYIPSKVTNPDGQAIAERQYETEDEAYENYDRLKRDSRNSDLRYGQPFEAPDRKTANEIAENYIV